MPMYNNPAIGQGFENLARMFAPPSPQEIAAGASAKATNEKASRLQALYDYARSAGFSQPEFDRMNVAVGNYNPTQSYQAQDQNDATARYNIDVDASTSRANNAADNARAITTNAADNAGALQRQFALPIKLGQGETAILPRQTADATGLDPRLSGAPKPLSETEVKGAERQNLRARGLLSDQDMIDAITGDRTPVEALDAAGRPTFMSPGAAVRAGARPAPRSPSTVINNGSESGDFYKEADKARGKSFNDVADAGATAQRSMIQIDELDRTLANVGTGGLAAMKQLAGSYGLAVGNTDDIQAATALINQLVPAQRPPGSGSMSDGDVALFKQSLPRIVNQPGGNALIIRTMRGIAQYDAQRGEIANRVLDREITPAEGRRMMSALPNPLAGFRQDSGDAGGSAQPAGATAAPVRVASPDEARRLPSGTRIILPDGTEGRVP